MKSKNCKREIKSHSKPFQLIWDLIQSLTKPNDDSLSNCFIPEHTKESTLCLRSSDPDTVVETSVALGSEEDPQNEETGVTNERYKLQWSDGSLPTTTSSKVVKTERPESCFLPSTSIRDRWVYLVEENFVSFAKGLCK